MIVELADNEAIKNRAAELCGQYETRACLRTDRQFAILMILQWIAGIALALWISPRTWIGQESTIHQHVFAAVFLGGVVSLGPIILILIFPGKVITRHIVAIGQMLTSSLLIHLSGGRIETHFHIFGSLAFLAFYRDWRVLLTASAVVAIDHLVRGAHWPMSIYGSPIASSWRSIEHTGWVLFEDIFLVLSLIQVRRATKDLALRQAQIEVISQAKSDFLSTVSHELRTPLNGILGMNDLLLATPLSDKQRQFLEASRNSGRVLLQLINDVLDLSKIEAGKLELDLRECALDTLIHDVVELLGHGARQKGLSLDCCVEPNARVTALCDENRLRQVLLNLIGNAIKFTSAGTVSVRAECTRQDKESMHVRFAITDTGIGIPIERQARLFSPFTQADSSITREFGGTGLGLAISKKLVELVGGQIGFVSKVGTGSTFWFEVPLQIIRDHKNSYDSWRGLADVRVLLVEDHDRERPQVIDCLKTWGCLPERVASDQEAMQAIIRARETGMPFDVVLADLQTNSGVRYQLFNQLARHDGLPVVGLGASHTEDKINLLRRFGLRRLLRDPVQPSELFDSLISLLSQKLIRKRRAATANTSRGHLQSRPSGRVLVAEDNHVNQMYIVELLKHYGCTCDVAANGHEVLAALQHGSYDLVLMDCQMPEMDGFTATREIRRRFAAQGHSPWLPIVALTANALEGDRERCLKAGMDDYLSKPLDPSLLQGILDRFLKCQISNPPAPIPADHETDNFAPYRA